MRVATVALACLLAAACGTSKQQLLATTASQVQLRGIQTRAFETTDRENTLRTVIATMQDLGFVVDHADYALGTVSGTKLDRSGLQSYALRMSVTVRPRGTTQLLVRANAQYNLVQVEDPEPYQAFFTALGRAMFLEAQQVD
jgi:hypothetical protein